MSLVYLDTPPTDDDRPYVPYGAARELFACRDDEILLEGPAGTGKSRGALEKVFIFVQKYDGARALICRQTRVSMTESVLVTFEDKVLPVGHYAKSGASRPQRDRYQFSNGSSIVVGGLDKADRLMSTEYDIIVVFEATEANEDDVDKLTTRLRNGRAPYQQLICDCNPAGPTHWLNRRASEGRMTRLLSRHKDNPAVTEKYLDKLRSLHGALRARLFEGKWVQSEGLVYDNFNRDHNVRAGSEFRSVVIGVDDGYADPFCAIRLELDGDKRMHASRMVYRSGLVENEKLDAMAGLIGEGESVSFVVDSSAAALIESMKRRGWHVIAAQKGPDSIVNGCHMVRQRFEVAGDGLPRLTVDPGCTDFLNEVDTYEWSKRNDGTAKDKPVDQHNHAMDAVRYAVMHVDRHVGFMIGAPPEKKMMDPSLSVSDAFKEMRKDPDWGF